MLHNSYLGLVGFLKGYYKVADNKPCGFALKGNYYRKRKADVA
jgi:hypothetical protein